MEIEKKLKILYFRLYPPFPMNFSFYTPSIGWTFEILIFIEEIKIERKEKKKNKIIMVNFLNNLIMQCFWMDI
jgi:hypothetical protein